MCISRSISNCLHQIFELITYPNHCLDCGCVPILLRRTVIYLDSFGRNDTNKTETQTFVDLHTGLFHMSHIGVCMAPTRI